MYAVRVSGSSVDEELSAQASRLAEQLICEQGPSGDPRASSVADAVLGEVRFSAGNPCVEHLTGTVHLYRQVLSREEAEHAGAGSLPVRYALLSSLLQKTAVHWQRVVGALKLLVNIA